MMQPSPDAPGGRVALTIAPDRRALVTGAASGFGLGVVDRLLEHRDVALDREAIQPDHAVERLRKFTRAHPRWRAILQEKQLGEGSERVARLAGQDLR